MKGFNKDSEIRVGVIGYGGAFNMGRVHLNEMKKAGMSPFAVTELDQARLKVATEEFPGIETYTSVATMLKKSAVDIVTIITPHNTHAKLALQCLRAGKSVVCEKPLAITTAECDKMIREAKKRGLLLSTYHNRHWDGCILEAVKQIRGHKVIGDVHRIECRMGGFGCPGNWWRTSKSISGGILYDWGVHLLEYSLQLMDDEIVEVSGFAKTGHWESKTTWKKDCIEDEGFAVVRFKRGGWLTLKISNLEANQRPGILEIGGTKGSYIMNHEDYELITPSGGKTRVLKAMNPQSEDWRFYQNIADHLTKGTKLVITPEWSRRPIHILDLADKSAKKGTALRAKYR
jgi:scyllo-inositol 2-dehydrogenase (NADP+)